MKKHFTRIIIVFISSVLIHQMLQQESRACNIAVVSATASATGRPFIWKNRDHAISYRHQVLFYPEVKAGVGGSLRLMGETTFNGTIDPTAVCTGGTNESGFAIANTTCLDSANDPFDMNNVNTDLMVKALEQCQYLSEFETVANNYKSYWSGKNISGIFAVIDAHGGAAIYEMYTNGNGGTMLFRKFNIDTGVVTDESGRTFTDIKYTQTTGFNNRTNSNHTRGWIDIWSDTPRELRARQLLTGMKANNDLTPRNIMRYVSKDVCGGNPADYCSTEPNVMSDWNVASDWNGQTDSYTNPNRAGQMYTRYAISRYQTTMGLVIEGAATPEQANLTTMWVALGEPSLSVFVPYFPFAHEVSKYGSHNKHSNSGYYWDGVSATQNVEDSCFLNLLFDCVEANPFSSSNYPELNNIYKNIALYTNNGAGNFLDVSNRNDGGFYLWPAIYKMDTTINYPRLMTLQGWTLPLENNVFDHTEDFLAILRANPSLITRDVLAKFSDYTNGYVYKNYSHQSASYSAWNYALPVDSVAPSVIAVYPDNGGVDAAVNSIITVKFSETIDETTLNNNTFQLLSGTRIIAGSILYNSSLGIATFTPVSPLGNNIVYTIKISTEITDNSGNGVAAQFTSNFKTIHSDDPNAGVPVISTINTGNNSTDFPVNGSIVVQFSEPMDAGTINTNTFIVSNGNTVIAGSVVYNSSNNTAVFTPDSFLSNDTTFTVELTTGITDISGVSIADNNSWTFKTSPEGTIVSPVSYVNPVDGSINFPVNGSISVKFNDLMVVSTINNSSFKVSSTETGGVEGLIEYDEASRTATFTPASPLNFSTTYIVELTSEIMGVAGKSFVNSYYWSFTTKANSIIVDPDNGGGVAKEASGSIGSKSAGCGCGSSAEASTSGHGAQPFLPGFVSLLGMMLFPYTLIWVHRKRRKK